MTNANIAIAERYFAAFKAKDLAAIRALHSPQFVAWSNFDPCETPLEEMLAQVQTFFSAVPNLRDEGPRFTATSTGFVAQFRYVGDASKGRLDVAVCTVVTVDDQGLVSRIDEYLDPAGFAVLGMSFG